jgi:hypothetical protein
MGEKVFKVNEVLEGLMGLQASKDIPDLLVVPVSPVPGDLKVQRETLVRKERRGRMGREVFHPIQTGKNVRGLISQKAKTMGLSE